jgi:hypothetical protein
MLPVDAFELRLDLIIRRSRLIALDIRLHGLILHVEWTGAEALRFLNSVRRFWASARG